MSQLPRRRPLIASVCLLAVGALGLGPAARTAHAAAVTVRDPAFGLPHIYADTDLELARENGREIAKDRLAQLILLARVGRGTLYQPFSLLDPSTLNGDVEARRTAYTSSELNNMFAKLPVRERDAIFEYCKGVNDTIDDIYAASLPTPFEVSLLGGLGFGLDLFGNATNVSDQVDPYYAVPGTGCGVGGCANEWPSGGFQFTPEMAMAIGVLEVRNFGLDGFASASRLAELQALVTKHGATLGAEIWDDLNFTNDPLAPVTVPDSTTPGYGGPLAAKTPAVQLAALAERYSPHDYAEFSRAREEAAERRAAQAAALGAWPHLGSYAWLIAGNKSASGWPWLGGFPQTGIQTPSIMHFVENRSAEGPDHRINGIGMEFAGAPLVLIGQNDTVAYTSTTAQLLVIDTFFEQLVKESSDTLHYLDEGTAAPLLKRTEIFRGFPTVSRVFWRTHERGGNKGSRAVTGFVGDSPNNATADSGTTSTLTDVGAFDAGFGGGHVAIVGGAGAGQIRPIASATADTLTVSPSFTTAPAAGSTYVAVRPANEIFAVALDSPAWLEESTTVLGFALFQRAEDVLDVRAAARLMPTTHNFYAADNQAFNGVGTMSGNGNIGYSSSGFARFRQGGEDLRLPLDGTQATNPLVVVSGTVTGATASTLSAASGTFSSHTFTAQALNYRYDNPTLVPSEYIVTITAGTGYKQTRRIASNDADSLTLEFPWGVTPAPGDSFEVYEILGMPETTNPSEGYMANWNNKAATTDPGDNFGRQFRHIFILERLAAENSWDRDKERQLNKDVAGLDGKGKFGRFLIPRLREAVDKVGNGGNPAVDSVLASLEANNGSPEFGRNFVDPVSATTNAGEIAFLNGLIGPLAVAIYGDEYAGAVGVPGGGRGLNIVQHAIDSKAGTPAGAYPQAYSGDYFNNKGDIDPFMCYLVKRTKGTPKFVQIDDLPLVDQFESQLAAVKRPRSLCAPADKNGEGILDEDTHLEEYLIRRGPGQPPHDRQKNVSLTDQFGTITLDTIRPELLMVPTGKALDAPAPPPSGAVEHFKCYKAKESPGTPKFQPVQVGIVDQFDSRAFEVKKPVRLCLPVEKDGEPVQNPVTHLVCYRVRKAKGQPGHQRIVGHIHLNNQFGEEQVDTRKESHLCVPAFKNGVTLDGWEITVRDAFSTAATGGVPADSPRGVSTYVHPLVALVPTLVFPPTPAGNRGTYEQIVEAGPDVLGEFMFPLGQSGFISAGGVPSPNFTTLHPIWRDWRFVPLLHVAEDLATDPDGDVDGDGVLDGFERWYFGDLTHGAASDDDSDGSSLLDEFTRGSDPTDSDTDDDGVLDGADSKPQDRLVS